MAFYSDDVCDSIVGHKDSLRQFPIVKMIVLLRVSRNQSHSKDYYRDTSEDNEGQFPVGAKCQDKSSQYL